MSATPEQIAERLETWAEEERDAARYHEAGGSFSIMGACEAQEDKLRTAASLIREQAKRVKVLEAELCSVLWWAEIGHYLFDVCGHAYGDGYSQPHELTISWEWQQSKPHTSGAQALRDDVDAWLAECRENEIGNPVIDARAALKAAP